MPRILDKIIINGEQAEGDWLRIHKQHGVMNVLGEELKALGLLKQTDTMRDEMQAACDAFSAACESYLISCRKITRDMQVMIDQHS